MYMRRFYKFMKDNVVINQKQKKIYDDRQTVVRSFVYYDGVSKSGALLGKSPSDVKK